MTDDEVEAMPAGREMDSLVAKMLGIHATALHREKSLAGWFPSTSMGDAFPLLLSAPPPEDPADPYRTMPADASLMLAVVQHKDDGRFVAGWLFNTEQQYADGGYTRWFGFTIGVADTAPLAICRFRLKQSLRDKRTAKILATEG